MGENAWKMVPVEPTIRMLEAAWSVDDAFHMTGRAHVWKAMLAAAPEPPAPSPVEEDAEIETAAEAIYNGWRDQPGWVPWMPRGNSDKQVDARREARRARTPTQEPTP